MKPTILPNAKAAAGDHAPDILNDVLPDTAALPDSAGAAAEAGLPDDIAAATPPELADFLPIIPMNANMADEPWDHVPEDIEAIDILFG